jgi:hypothetical protein
MSANIPARDPLMTDGHLSPPRGGLTERLSFASLDRGSGGALVR